MKKILILFFFGILFTSCKSTSAISNSKKDENSKYIVDNLIRTASKSIGVKYKFGGTSKAGYDCSGLMFTTFNAENISLPRTSYEQSKIGKIITLRDAEKGDLIFFKTNKNSKINHVGLISDINHGEIKFIHASTSKGVIISSMNEKYYQKTFEQVNRVIEKK